MSNVQQFIDLVGQGENAQAQETLSDILSAKAFDALESFKQQVGENLFATEESVQVDEETEQLDEISLGTASRAYKERIKRSTYAPDDEKSTHHLHKGIDTIERIAKLHGDHGARKAQKDMEDSEVDTHNSRGNEPKYVPVNKKGALKRNPNY
jgi:hypothetical protein